MTSSRIDAPSAAPKQGAKGLNPKVAVPVLLFTFVFCLVIDNGFKFMTQPIGEALHLSAKTAGMQATLAGILIGIGAVVYAALADSISIRKLLIVGIGMVVVGSLIGFIGQASWPMVLTGRLIQTCGLAAAETLYVIYVTKHIPTAEQKTYLGFSTASFQGAMLIGVLSSGFITTHISWTAFFLLPLILILAVPFILKTVPKEEATTGSLDVVGLFMVAVLAASCVMFMQWYNVKWLLLGAVAIVLFAIDVWKNPKALVRPEFFKNGRYVWALVVVLFVYSTQLGWIISFPFLVHELHGLSIDSASLLIAPGYLCATLVGIFSGAIGKILPSRPAIIMALCGIVVALLLPAVFPTAGVSLLVISMILFGSGFALMYAPLVATAIRDIPAERSGIAIGFYNLVINVAIPTGIAIATKLLDDHLQAFSGLTTGSGESAVSYASLLWVLAIIAMIGLVIYVVTDLMMTRR